MGRKIVVNGLFDGLPCSGANRYASEMLRGLGRDIEVIKPRATLTGVGGLVWEQFVLPRMIRGEEFLWSPAGSGPLVCAKQVLTIHDLAVLEHPEWFEPTYGLLCRLLLPRLVQRVEKLSTVSEFSRRAIRRRFGLGEDVVTVIPAGVNLQQFHPCDPAPLRAKYGIGERYILFVGSLDPRKNLDRLLQAWVRLPELKDLELVIAGAELKHIFRPPELPTSKRRTRFLGAVPDEDLPALYAGATVFIMPSLFEGSGLTILEAMACGAPVLTSNAGALPEIAGSAAAQFDPTSVEGMTEALRNVLLNEGLRQELSRRGMERACQFPWDAAVKDFSRLVL